MGDLFCVTILSETVLEEIAINGILDHYRSRLVVSINNKIREYQIIRSKTEVEESENFLGKGAFKIRDKVENRKSIMRTIEFNLFRGDAQQRSIT